MEAPLHNENETEVAVTHHEVKNVVLVEHSLWKKGVSSASPSPGSSVLSLPFQFHLPEKQDLPPAFFHHWRMDTVKVLYSIEVVGHRPGMLHLARKVHVPIIVIPQGDIHLRTSLRAAIALGGDGPHWRMEHKEQLMHKGHEGGMARVEVCDPPCP